MLGVKLCCLAVYFPCFSLYFPAVTPLGPIQSFSRAFKRQSCSWWLKSLPHQRELSASTSLPMTPNTGHAESDNRVEQYLINTMNALDNDFVVAITEQHRKPMLRGLLGWTKPEFDARARELLIQEEWNKTKAFVNHNLKELKQLPVAQDATQFHIGLDSFEDYQDRPSKLFTFMARGRTYQGKFERLLEDVKPEWLDEFQEIQVKRTELETLRLIVENEHESSPYSDLLMSCLEYDFPPAAPQPSDGGKAKGVQNEMNLLAFLKEELLGEAETSSPGIGKGNLKLLAPVFLQNRRKGRNPNAKCPYVIELPSEYDLHGRSTELDAVVVQFDEEDENRVQIIQVWEAKSTLSPVTIADALQKKANTIRTIVDPEHEAILGMHGNEYTIRSSLPNEEKSLPPMPLLGLFGKKLLPPRAASRRLQIVLGENLLERDPRVIENALQNGCISLPSHRVKSELKELVDLAKTLRPTMVVSSELDKKTT